MTRATHNGFPQDVRSAVELYLAKGLAPLPLLSREKKCGLNDWPNFRADRNRIADQFPDGCNLGLLLGQGAFRLVDVDIDDARALAVAADYLPATGMIHGRPGKPQSHSWYIVAGDGPIPSESFKDIDGSVILEVRGDRHQTMVPPSTHPNGEVLAWEKSDAPSKVEQGTLQKFAGIIAAAVLIGRHWRRGSRDQAAMALAGALCRAGWPIEEVERFIGHVAKAAKDEELRSRVVKAPGTFQHYEDGKATTGWPTLARCLGEFGQEVVDSARKWLGMVQPVPRKVRELPSYKPFPVEALPESLAEYVRQSAKALGCDPVFVALPVLAVLASMIGGTRTIRLKRGWEEPSIVWACVLADSGTLKSPAWRRAVAYVFRLQKRLRQEYKKNMARYQEELAKYNQAKHEFKNGKGPDPGDPPEEPVLQRIVVSDITIEKMAEILEDNPRGILGTRDELAGWLQSFQRYKGKNGGSDLPHWLEIWQAGTILVDRKTGPRPHYFVERAVASIAGTIQPGVLARALTPDFLDAGGAARILLAMPTKLPKRWSEVEVDPECEQSYKDVLDKLLALEFDEKDGEKAPHVLHLSPEAKESWVKFYNAWAKEQAAVEGELAAAFSKLEAYAARLALLHHVVSKQACGKNDLAPIQRESVEAGVILSRWFAHEARRIYATLTETEEERNTRRLVEFIRSRGKKITTKQLQRSNSRKYPTSEAATSALDALAESAYGQWVDQVPDARGGRPTRYLVLHPTTDETDETPTDEDDSDDGLPTKPPDETPLSPNATLKNAGECEVSSVSSGALFGNGDCLKTDAEGDLRKGVSSDGRGVSSDPVPYLLARDRAGLDTVIAAIDETLFVGVDLETTGLDPRKDRIRLLSLSLDTTDGGTFSYLVDCFAVDPAPLWERLADKELVFHNAAFDLAFLDRLGFNPSTKLRCTMLLSQLFTSGTFESNDLAACCNRHLGRTLDKSDQKSDWSGELTAHQFSYAAADVEVLAPLLKALAVKIEEAGLVEVAKIEQRCLPALVWMKSKGVAFDAEACRALAQKSESELESIRTKLDTAAPSVPGSLAGCGSWNWDSPLQTKEVLTLLGFNLESTADEMLATVDHPLADLLRQYRAAAKLVTSYGRKLLEHVAPDGRIYPSWRQIGAASGRMSCSNPNLQQLPRGDYRLCIVAPAGRVLVKADYSQIELRIAAKVSGDQALLEAYRQGEDLHTRTARAVLGICEVTKQHRQLAKALNFGLLYGMGAKGFRQYANSQYRLNLTDEEACRYRDAFFRSYPGLATWHRRVKSRRTKETRTLAGRRQLLEDKTPDPLRLNTPIQGTGADGLKLALALLWERRARVPGAFPVLAVHDEIVVEAGEGQADSAANWLKEAMVEAMAPLVDPVPVSVEVMVARTWGGS